MDCKQFREVLDLYVDGELSAAAAAAAAIHLDRCSSCKQAERQLLRLRANIKAAVARHQLPAGLQRDLEARFSTVKRSFALPAVLLAAFVLMAAFALPIPTVRGAAANLVEQVAFRLDTPRTLVLEGRLICRDCELQRMYGAMAACARKGHHGALETSDGKIWNLMENDRSDALIHNDALRGRKVRIRGKIYRRAGCLEVESYEVL